MRPAEYNPEALREASNKQLQEVTNRNNSNNNNSNNNNTHVAGLSQQLGGLNLGNRFKQTHVIVRFMLFALPYPLMYLKGKENW